MSWFDVVILFSPRPGSSPHPMGTWLKQNKTKKKLFSDALLVVFFILYVWRLSGAKHLAPRPLQPFHPILPTEPWSSSSGRGLSWRMPEACFNLIGGGASSTCGSFSCNTHTHTHANTHTHTAAGACEEHEVTSGFTADLCDSYISQTTWVKSVFFFFFSAVVRVVWIFASENVLLGCLLIWLLWMCPKWQVPQFWLNSRFAASLCHEVHWHAAINPVMVLYH